MAGWAEVDIVIVASGLAELEALPHLLRSSIARTGRRVAIVYPARNAYLSHQVAANLIKANYWGLYPRPQKIVILVDADSSAPSEAETQMRLRLQPLVADVMDQGLDVLVTAAKWHLEAWFFGDPAGLREFLHRDLGNVDLSNPDAIPTPKHHLRNLLPRLYTAKVAGDIARALDPGAVRQNSRSFAGFEAAVENGVSGG